MDKDRNIILDDSDEGKADTDGKPSIDGEPEIPIE